MPEPDFDQIALVFIKALNDRGGCDLFRVDEGGGPLSDRDREWVRKESGFLAEKFRQVWNARGAADVDWLGLPDTLKEHVRKLDR